MAPTSAFLLFQTGGIEGRVSVYASNMTFRYFSFLIAAFISAGSSFWDLCKYSIKATTFAGVYVDGDRERIPYEADADLNQLSHYTTDDNVAMAATTFDWLIENGTWPTSNALVLLYILLVRLRIAPSSFQGPSSQVPAEQVPNRPVERVSWNMIQGFEVATGLRLPTEAEWEYACRAGTMTAFNLPPDGTNDDGLLGQLAWFSSNAASQTRPVGQKQANNLGLHDMHGNVWEWVEDWDGIDYYSQSPPIDPPGPISGTNRVLRGGSWANSSFYCRASYRASDLPVTGFSNDGFRVARTP